MTRTWQAAPSVGHPLTRVEGLDKVTGQARYAGDVDRRGLVHGWVVPATIPRGRVLSLDVEATLAMPGVLAVLHQDNAPRLTDIGEGTLFLFQGDRVAHWGAPVALVIADTPERAREAAERMRVDYLAEPPDTVFRPDHPGLYRPEHVNPRNPTVTEKGDVEAALAGAAVVVDAEYRTPAQHNNAMEPHSATAEWADGRLTVHTSTQYAYGVAQSLTKLFDLAPGTLRVLSEHVGGGFGNKGMPARPDAVLAVMAATLVGRPVRVTLTRPQLFPLTGYRTPTAQRLRLGATADGRLVAVEHTAAMQTSRLAEFTEQTAIYARAMYAADNLRTDHRVVALDVPTPRWMRAPGEAPGSFGLESAMDELAEACGVDPVELRLRNDTSHEPASGQPFSSRRLAECLREGARRFGWAERDPRPAARREARWWRGTGVAGAHYPARTAPTTAHATALPGGRYVVRVAATDIGTGARTALTQLAADALEVPVDAVRVEIGDSDFGPAMGAGGSMGTASWSWPVVTACHDLARRIASGEPVPPEGLTSTFDSTEAVGARAEFSRYAFGAHFAEVAVDVATGEVRVPRLLGVYAVGRVVNPLTATSQLIGGMTMGLSTALLEESTLDGRFGDFVNHNLADYHVATNADVGAIEVAFVDDPDDELNPSGVKGLGEIGIVGVPAAIANAVWHATGVRQRELPISPARAIISGQ
ncbi:xanthine dehydrogenase family protein molybdopterin-binding subunit [Asanoa sp. WMMD1127]|uniref:xanthine dehydrogenase family protein molybdopterin-binding subunit n=1 Tax=Asanoa sp. WMMD1127 TaxID=3016107 RepID=UPI0024164359|nr:xanthine dehydrogenase family protein molybdopterin-binding subunit [Asanoa sp. WMMD1127]MDG4826367.1 xanthine dehydrogenase family protein molybdopterin-binding subunit [Asanoa sp. WMMD1127]